MVFRIYAMTPPKRFWPFYDDQEVEIYDSLSWDLPGRTRTLDRRRSLSKNKKK